MDVSPQTTISYVKDFKLAPYWNQADLFLVGSGVLSSYSISPAFLKGSAQSATRSFHLFQQAESSPTRMLHPTEPGIPNTAPGHKEGPTRSSALLKRSSTACVEGALEVQTCKHGRKGT